MTEPAALRNVCLAAIERAGLHAAGELFHRYAPAPHASPAAPVGITGVVLLAESHLAVHTWPELGSATLDVYVCNLGADNSSRAEALFAELIAAFGPASIERHAIGRGGTASRAGSASASASASVSTSTSTSTPGPTSP